MSDESLFREVDEEVRQDELKSFWNRHSKLLTGLAVAVVAAVGGYEAYKYYTVNQSEKAAAVYFDALKKSVESKPEDALAALKAVPAGTGFAQLSAIKQADLLASEGKLDEAVAALDGLAKATGQDKVIAEIAQIKAAYLLVDTKSPDEVGQRVSAFNTATSPWRHQARDIMALTNFRAKDYAKVKEQIDQMIADPKSPPAMLQRAQVLLQLIEPHLSAK